jgi:CP family cyanate transporter-like MFS transporter
MLCCVLLSVMPDTYNVTAADTRSIRGVPVGDEISPRSRSLLLIGLFAGALALRPQLVGIGPLLPAIQRDLHLSHAVAGTLPAIPVLCMGVLAASAGFVLRRANAGWVVSASLGVIALFGIVRSQAPTGLLLVIATIPIGAGTGVALALMPVIVKRVFPHRPAFATGVYTTGLNVGSAASALAAAPLAAGGGGWRDALLVLSLACGLVAGMWFAAGAHAVRMEDSSMRSSMRLIVGTVTRHRTVWLLVSLFSAMGIVFYGLTSWVPDIYVEHGWSSESAGALVAAFAAIAAPVSLVVPWLADRRGSRRFYLVASSALMMAACCGIALAPGGGWVWVVLAGVGIGILFPVLMTLPLDLAQRPSETAAIAGVVLGIGYSVAALTPTGLGAVRDLTGSFSASVAILVIVSAGMVVLAAQCSPERLLANPS